MTYLENKGVTLVELIVGTLVLGILVASVYATYISTANFLSFTKEELSATAEASRWIERVRTGGTSATRYNSLTNVSDRDLNANNSILQENYTDPAVWPFAGVAKDLIAEYTIDDNKDLGSGAPFKFKKITVKVKWKQRM
jgi:prepilin-type N-terminal cleavage/methylation domain-containing protein